MCTIKLGVLQIQCLALDHSTQIPLISVIYHVMGTLRLILTGGIVNKLRCDKGSNLLRTLITVDAVDQEILKMQLNIRFRLKLYKK